MKSTKQVARKAPNKTPLAEYFLKLMKEGKSEIHYVYYSIFSILTLEELNDILSEYRRIWSGKDSYFKKEGKAIWFTVFHKSIRQTDFFNECYRKREVKLLSESEKSEFYFLMQKVSKEGYVKQGEGRELFNEEYRRFLALSEKRRCQKREISIGGRLDSILWNLIHVDKDDVLQGTMLLTFEDE